MEVRTRILPEVKRARARALETGPVRRGCVG
jgi:hypothetical protein